MVNQHYQKTHDLGKSCEGQRSRVLIKKLNQLKKEILAERKLSIQGLNCYGATIGDQSAISCHFRKSLSGPERT
ncbi:hypothetical protein Leryth_005575 [Lithospermum erythrorhizon]|nr:hypothetical protein Leryth_005575 [Lithospermum erythrorhizon]